MIHMTHWELWETITMFGSLNLLFLLLIYGHLKQEIKTMASTTQAGLAALQQADTDLAAAVTANTTASQAVVAEISALQAQLAASEDPAVQAIAADLETKVAALTANNTALAAAAAPPAPAPAPAPTPAPAASPGFRATSS